MRRHLLMIALAGLVATPVLAKKQELPDVTEEGLVRIPDSELAVVYADPDANLTPYTKVHILDTYVAFKKNWVREQNRSGGRIKVTNKDMEKMKVEMAEEFTTVFTEVLEENDGYPVVDHGGEDVLLVRPAIIDLNPIAPDTMRADSGYTFSESAGDATLYIEIYDSVTGDLLAKGLDKRYDRQAGYMQWQTSVSNKQAARRILKGWAQVLRDALDEAHKLDGSQ